MPDDHDHAVLICGFPNDAYIVEGSTPATCSRCQADIVVSPSGQEILVRELPEIETVCAACGSVMMDEDDNCEIAPLTPSQVADILLAMSVPIKPPL